MTDLHIKDFHQFFCEALSTVGEPCPGGWHPGHFSPYPWQEKLLQHVLTGSWPEQIAAPTAAGKTAVIEVHAFACALMAAGCLNGPVPRRLALIVDRRALVDDQYLHARRLAERLALATGSANGSAMARVGKALDGWRWKLPDAATEPLLVSRLRGGAPPDRDWLHDPMAAAIVCCTPDMFGSRLLFRGYGSSRAARPREAGLLGHDTVAVIDEAHLNRQLLRTARRVRELQELPPGGSPALPLQVVETTATPTTIAASAVAVGPGDLGSDELRRRMTTPKPVRLLHTNGRAFQKSASPTKAFIDAAVKLRGEFGPTIAVYVNTVAAAVKAAAELRDRAVDGQRLTVEVLCGRLRRYDFDRVLADHPGLLTGADSTVDILVATQTLEVGVDADFAAAISELAPGAALAQRSGRVNRRGQRPETCFTVALPDGPIGDSPPYVTQDLDAAKVWLQRRANDADGLAPVALIRDSPAPPQLRRAHLQRLELAETWQFSRTIDELAADQQPALWIEDDLEADSSVGIVARQAMPSDGIDAARLVRDLGVDPREVFPTRIGDAAAVVRSILKDRDADAGAVVRAPSGDTGEAQPLATADDLRPGDIVVVDSQTKLQIYNVIVQPGAEGVGPADDVLSLLDGRARYRLEPKPGDDGPMRDHLEAAAAELADGTGRRQRDSAARALDRMEFPEARQAARLLRQRLSACDVAVHYDVDGTFIRLIVVERAANTGADRQERSASAAPVPLHQHSTAVRDRAGALGAALALDPHLQEALALGGYFHDLGKADHRFQVRLGAQPGSEHLAKSGAQASSAEDGSGLPTGWRHEQLSAVLATRELASVAATSHMAGTLSVRLAGTSHGHGRPGFRHSAADLLGDGVIDPSIHRIAEQLFDSGDWDELVESTERHWGAWGCAFLEALLRAADTQVSAEGS